MIEMYESGGAIICQTFVDVDHPSKQVIPSGYRYVIQKAEENDFLNYVIRICTALKQETTKWTN